MLTLRDKLVAALRGGGHPAGVALAVGIGLVAGFASGVNLTFAGLLWLAIVLNVRSSVFVVTWAIGLALAIGGHSICHGVGYAMLDELSLGELIAKLGDSPIVALLDWDRYALVGGIAIAIVLAVPAARGAWTVADARWRAAHEANPPRRSLMRPLAWLYAPIAAVPLVFLPWVLVERQLSDELLGEAVAFSEYRATAERTELCLLTGAWLAENVTVLPREQPDKPVLRIERIQAKLDSSRLLRGWLHVSDLKLAGVTRFDTPRTSTEGATHEPTTGAAELHAQLVGWCERRDLLAWSSDLLNLCDRLAQHDQQQTGTSAAKLFGALSSLPDETRSRLGRRQPRVVVDAVQLVELSQSWHLGGKAAIEIAHLNSNPRLALYPTHIKVTAPEWSSEAEVTLNLHESGQRHQLKVRAVDLPLAELLDPARTRSRLVVHRGLVTAIGEGWIDLQRAYLPLSLESQQLSAQMLGAQPVAGLSSEHWNRCLRELGGLRVDALISGRWDDLRLTLETREAIQQLKHQLRSAGAHELLSGVEEEQSNPRVPQTASTVPHLPVIEQPTANISPVTNIVPGYEPIAPVSYPTASESTPSAYPTATSPASPSAEPPRYPVTTASEPSSATATLGPIESPLPTATPEAVTPTTPFVNPLASTLPPAPTPVETAPSVATPYPATDAAPVVAATPAPTPTLGEPAVSPNPYVSNNAPLADSSPMVPIPAPLDDAPTTGYPMSAADAPTPSPTPVAPTSAAPQSPENSIVPYRPRDEVPATPVAAPSQPTATVSDTPKSRYSSPSVAPTVTPSPTKPSASPTAISDTPRSPAAPVTGRVSAPTAAPNAAGYIGSRPYYATRPSAAQTGSATAGLDVPTGPDLEGLYARGQVNGPASPTLPQKPAPSREPKSESGFAQWSAGVSNKFSSMFSRNSATSDKPKATGTPTPAAPKSQATIAGRPATGGDTSFATDAPTQQPTATDSTATKSWLDKFRR
ncbi:MAG: hypothetical protein JNM18_27005 [Planctomycetaceae bacterium]|nr:hypothetical protein [Planctomycetaceae bacterium]